MYHFAMTAAMPNTVVVGVTTYPQALRMVLHETLFVSTTCEARPLEISPFSEDLWADEGEGPPSRAGRGPSHEHVKCSSAVGHYRPGFTPPLLGVLEDSEEACRGGEAHDDDHR